MPHITLSHLRFLDVDTSGRVVATNVCQKKRVGFQVDGCSLRDVV
jgi:hypothetical protein